MSPSSRSITNQFLQNFQWLVTYLPDMQWQINNLKYVTPFWGSPTSPQSCISKYMISLAISNEYDTKFSGINLRIMSRRLGQKSLILPPLGIASPPYYKTHDVSANYEPISTKLSAIGHLFSWYALILIWIALASHCYRPIGVQGPAHLQGPLRGLSAF